MILSVEDLKLFVKFLRTQFGIQVELNYENPIEFARFFISGSFCQLAKTSPGFAEFICGNQGVKNAVAQTFPRWADQERFAEMGVTSLDNLLEVNDERED